MTYVAPEEDEFIIRIDRNYIDTTKSIIKYDAFFGSTYKGSFSDVRLDWDAQTDDLLEGYNIYFSVHPMIKYKANTTGVIIDNFYQMSLPLLPKNIIFYFWISKVVSGVETFLNTLGQTTYDSAKEEDFGETAVNPMDPNNGFPETDNINDQLKDLLQRIEDDKLMALQMVGVKCDVFLRKWGTQEPYGIPCACTEDNQDPDFIGNGRCPVCFGTGLVGGFYPPIEMFIRFPNKPSNDFKGFVKGLTLSQTYDGWSIPKPILRSQDMILRKVDGRRWIVRDVQVSFFRGASTEQFFALDLIQQTDIRQIVSADTIAQAENSLNDPRFSIPGRENF